MFFSSHLCFLVFCALSFSLLPVFVSSSAQFYTECSHSAPAVVASNVAGSNNDYLDFHLATTRAPDALGALCGQCYSFNNSVTPLTAVTDYVLDPVSNAISNPSFLFKQISSLYVFPTYVVRVYTNDACGDVTQIAGSFTEGFYSLCTPQLTALNKNIVSMQVCNAYNINIQTTTTPTATTPTTTTTATTANSAITTSAIVPSSSPFPSPSSSSNSNPVCSSFRPCVFLCVQGYSCQKDFATCSYTCQPSSTPSSPTVIAPPTVAPSPSSSPATVMCASGVSAIVCEARQDAIPLLYCIRCPSGQSCGLDPCNNCHVACLPITTTTPIPTQTATCQGNCSSPGFTETASSSSSSMSGSMSVVGLVSICIIVVFVIVVATSVTLLAMRRRRQQASSSSSSSTSSYSHEQARAVTVSVAPIRLVDEE